MTRQSGFGDSGPAAAQALHERRDFARSFDSLDEIFAFVEAMLDARSVSRADAYAITMTIEELFTNMVKYNAAGTGRIGLEVECAGTHVACVLTDPDSDRFDMTAAPDANIALPVEQRRPGGLGIHLIRRLVDSIDYDYSERCSRVRFRKTRTDRAPGAPPVGGLEPPPEI